MISRMVEEAKRQYGLVLSVLLFLSAGLLLSGCMPSEEDVAKAEELVQEAEGYVEESEYARAMGTYEEAKALDEGNADIYTGIADMYLLKNRVDDAEEVLNAGLSKARKTGDIYGYLGDISLSKGAVDEGIQYLKKAGSKGSEDDRFTYLLGLAYVREGSYESAQDVLDIDEDGGEWYVRGALLSAITYWDDTQTAREILEVAVDADVDQSITSLLEVYLEDLDRVDQLEEDAPVVYRDVILSHGALEAGYGHVVIAKLEPYAEDEKEYWDLFLYLGQAYEIEREYESARTYLEEAVALNPADPFGPWHLARVYSELGLGTEKETMYKRAIALSGAEDRIDIRREYADALLLDGQYELFDEQMTALKEEDPDKVNEYELKHVSSLIDRDLTEEALSALDTIAQSELDEDGQAQYSWLKGLVLFEQGSRDEALVWAEDAVSLVSLEARYHLLLGQVYFESGDEDQATTSLERAIDLDLEGEVSAEAMKILDRM